MPRRSTAAYSSEHREKAAARLVELVAEAGNHPTTGFASTRYLVATLAECGFPELALEMLTTSGYPSWLEMLDRGGTTIWERWDGVDEHGIPRASLNHLNKGSVLSFLHEYVGGIRPPDPDDPTAVGYRRFVIEPFMAPQLEWARTRLHTPAGPIETFWDQHQWKYRAECRCAPRQRSCGPPARWLQQQARPRTAHIHHHNCGSSAAGVEQFHRMKRTPILR